MRLSPRRVTLPSPADSSPRPAPLRYPGLATVRLSPASPDAAPNSGSALVQYEIAAQAGVAREALDGFLVDRDAPMKVQFA